MAKDKGVAATEHTKIDGLGLGGDYEEKNLEQYFWRARHATTPLAGKVVATVEGIETVFSKNQSDNDDEDKTMQCLIVLLDKPATWKDKLGAMITAPEGSFVRVPSNNAALRTVHIKARNAIARGFAIGVAIEHTGTRPSPKGEQNLYRYFEQKADKWSKLADIAPDMIGYTEEKPVAQFEVSPVAAPKQLGAGN